MTAYVKRYLAQRLTKRSPCRRTRPYLSTPCGAADMLATFACKAALGYCSVGRRWRRCALYLPCASTHATASWPVTIYHSTREHLLPATYNSL